MSIERVMAGFAETQFDKTLAKFAGIGGLIFGWKVGIVNWYIGVSGKSGMPFMMSILTWEFAEDIIKTAVLALTAALVGGFGRIIITIIGDWAKEKTKNWFKF